MLCGWVWCVRCVSLFNTWPAGDCWNGGVIGDGDDELGGGRYGGDDELVVVTITAVKLAVVTPETTVLVMVKAAEKERLVMPVGRPRHNGGHWRCGFFGGRLCTGTLHEVLAGSSRDSVTVWKRSGYESGWNSVRVFRASNPWSVNYDRYNGTVRGGPNLSAVERNWLSDGQFASGRPVGVIWPN